MQHIEIHFDDGAGLVAAADVKCGALIGAIDGYQFVFKVHSQIMSRRHFNQFSGKQGQKNPAPGLKQPPSSTHQTHSPLDLDNAALASGSAAYH